jgi:TonB family protein
MGYQVLLFCPDEKLARVVRQVFEDLDFNVEAVQEPFSAVKKLMAQRYDALVVDCENESNASLLFKSARNSNSNQGTLAIAVVEGQAGVAKAYRIGANLVLTKPVNVEQAKGTLRVARGLLRKNSEIATSTAVPSTIAAAEPARATSPPASTPSIPAATSGSAVASPVAPKVAREVPEFEPVTPAIAASADVVETSAVSARENLAETILPQSREDTAQDQEATKVIAAEPKQVSGAAASLATSSSGNVAAAQAIAAAPARVKEITPPETSTLDLEYVDPVLAGAESEMVGSTPSFSALDLDQAPRSSGSTKVLIAGVVLLALAALGYFGWTKFHPNKPASPTVHPMATPQASAPVQGSGLLPAASAPDTASAPVPTSNRSALTGESAVSRISQPAQGAKSMGPTVIRLDVAPETATKAEKVAPLKVKSGTVKDPKTEGEDANGPVLSPLAVAGTDPRALNSLVTSSPATTRRPLLAAVKISQGVSQGLLIKRVNPKYPSMAIAMRQEGTVLLDATIDREGKISALHVVKGDQILARAATDAVRQWRYKPYLLDGEPVEIQTQITINFKLPN